MPSSLGGGGISIAAATAAAIAGFRFMKVLFKILAGSVSEAENLPDQRISGACVANAKKLMYARTMNSAQTQTEIAGAKDGFWLW